MQLQEECSTCEYLQFTLSPERGRKEHNGFFFCLLFSYYSFYFPLCCRLNIKVPWNSFFLLLNIKYPLYLHTSACCWNRWQLFFNCVSFVFVFLQRKKAKLDVCSLRALMRRPVWGWRSNTPDVSNITFAQHWAALTLWCSFIFITARTKFDKWICGYSNACSASKTRGSSLVVVSCLLASALAAVEAVPFYRVISGRLPQAKLRCKAFFFFDLTGTTSDAQQEVWSFLHSKLISHREFQAFQFLLSLIKSLENVFCHRKWVRMKFRDMLM